MFILDTSDELLIKNWPVQITVPADGGKTKTHEITVDFALLPDAEVNAITKEALAGHEGKDVELLSRILKGVRGVQDADGNELELNDDLIRRLTRRRYIAQAIFDEYFNATAGKKAQRKN